MDSLDCSTYGTQCQEAGQPTQVYVQSLLLRLVADLGVAPWIPKFSKSGNSSHGWQHIDVN